MKTIVTQNKKITKSLSALLILLALSFMSNPLNAQNQTTTVKGIVNSDIGPLNGVSIYLQNSKTGTVSKKDGSFTFPSALKAGDVLIFSYLGFEKQSIIITENSSYLDVFMKEAPIDVLSAINSNKPYKSKRPKS